jgi:hypothetical protein
VQNVRLEVFTAMRIQIVVFSVLTAFRRILLPPSLGGLYSGDGSIRVLRNVNNHPQDYKVLHFGISISLPFTYLMTSFRAPKTGVQSSA